MRVKCGLGRNQSKAIAPEFAKRACVPPHGLRFAGRNTMNENRSAVNVEPRRVCLLAAVSLVFSFHLFPQAFAQSVLLIDKLERQDLLLAKKEVAFSALLEGTVSDPDLAVFVLVHQPRLGGWRIFPATTDARNRETNGGYRWRAICHFGEFDGRGVGDSHQIKAIAVDRARIGTGNLPLPLPADIPQTGLVTVKRVK